MIITKRFVGSIPVTLEIWYAYCLLYIVQQHSIIDVIVIDTSGTQTEQKSEKRFDISISDHVTILFTKSIAQTTD